MAQQIFTKENVNQHAQANRESDYQKIIHPMLVQLQLGRITQEQLQAAVAEIDAKYPFVTEDLVIDMGNSASVNINQGA
jgi:pyrroloquinoline quinone (PQQ) biosynthesis protein C